MFMCRLFEMEECSGLSQREKEAKRNREYVAWFKRTYGSGKYETDVRINPLLDGPNTKAITSEGYIVNGFRFHVDSILGSIHSDCSGVCVKGAMGGSDATNCYGTLKEVLQVVYWSHERPLYIVMFKCVWYDINAGTVEHATYKLVDIDPKVTSWRDEPFVFANQAKQAYYVPYPNKTTGRPGQEGWLAVTTIPARHIIDYSSVAGANDVESGMPNQVLQENVSEVVNLFVDLTSFDMNIQLATDVVEMVDEYAVEEPEEPFVEVDEDEEEEDNEEKEEGEMMSDYDSEEE